jgi:hypothetical protein
LLTFETDANGVSKSTNEQGSFLGWFVGPILAVQEVFYPALAALVGPVQNSFFLTVHYFSSIVHITKQVGQAVLSGRLSLIVCVSDGDCTKAEFRNPDKSLKSFPPCYSQFYSFA